MNVFPKFKIRGVADVSDPFTGFIKYLRRWIKSSKFTYEDFKVQMVFQLVNLGYRNAEV